MRKIILLSIASCALIAMSCNDDQNNSSTQIEEVNNNTNITTLAEANDQSSEENITSNTSKENVTQNSTSTSNPFADLKGNNPEHGQPGHRCDIPVGAALNTPPQNATQVSNTQTTTTSTPTQPTNIQTAPIQNPMPAQTTAPGFSGKPNPAHGQPGHRCDMEVGQILP